MSVHVLTGHDQLACEALGRGPCEHRQISPLLAALVGQRLVKKCKSAHA